MKKIKAPQPIAVMQLCNTAAIIISDLDAYDETVRYYIASDNDNMVEVHKAKIYYHVRDNAPYFNSVQGRMLIDNFIKC